MKYLSGVLSISVIAMLLLPSIAHADGAMLSHKPMFKKSGETPVVKEPEQQAVILFTGDMEQLIISPTYQGPSGRLAWIVPVPARPVVDTADMRIFVELKALLRTKPSQSRFGSSSGFGGAGQAGKPAVEVIERKVIGGYDISVIESADGTELMRWLESNEFRLPSNARSPIVDYVRGGWFFVACKVTAPDAVEPNDARDLSPIRIRFPVSKPIYPLRLSAANPGAFDILVYIISPMSAIGSTSTNLVLDRGPRKCTLMHRVVAVLPRVVPGESSDPCPALLKLVDDDTYIWRESLQLLPSDCRRDVLWYAPGSVEF